MKFNSRDISLTAVFAALYAVLVLALAGFSFQIVQVRIADALIPLSIVFGWPVVLGVTVGCVVANIASPMPSIITDITLGSLANFIASLVAWRVGLWKTGKGVSELLGCLAATVLITFIVGTYLAVLTEMELWVWWLGIGIGSIISITVIGYALVQILKRLTAKPSTT
ncbi:MAG TPA: QueT transporter family protein [Acidobacteriota bacterium]|nr:QueT transporter family protein [Acidobacteriota bacterium]